MQSLGNQSAVERNWAMNRVGPKPAATVDAIFRELGTSCMELIEAWSQFYRQHRNAEHRGSGLINTHSNSELVTWFQRPSNINHRSRMNQLMEGSRFA
jgi:hypothetical protein